MTDRPAADEPSQQEHRLELRQEALTTALYVAICLLVALLALPESAVDHVPLLGVIWGGTIGLALVHWFAFRVAARLLGAGKIRQHDLELGAVQLAGAAAVAALASIPALLPPGFLEGPRHRAAVGWPHCCRRVLRCMGRRRDPAPLSRLRGHCPGDCWDSRRYCPHVAVVCRRLGKGITSRSRAITTAVFPARARACSPSGVRSA